MTGVDVANDDGGVTVVLVPSRVTTIVGGVCSMADDAVVTSCADVACEDVGAAHVTLAGAAVARAGVAHVTLAGAAVARAGAGEVVVVVSDDVVVASTGTTGMRVTTTMGEGTAGILCRVTVATHPPDLGGPRFSGTDAAGAFVGWPVFATDATVAAGDDDADVVEGVDDGADEGVDDGADESVDDGVDDGADDGVDDVDDADVLDGAFPTRAAGAACVTRPAGATLPAGGTLTAEIRSGDENRVGRVAAEEAAGGILPRCTGDLA